MVVAVGLLAGGPVEGGRGREVAVAVAVGLLAGGPVTGGPGRAVVLVVALPGRPFPRPTVVRSGAGSVFAWGPSCGGGWA